MESKLNFARQKHIGGVIALTFYLVQSELTLLCSNAITNLLFSMLSGFSEYGFLPYFSMVLDGNFSLFVRSFHEMLGILGNFKRLQLIKAYAPYLELMDYWAKCRTDIFEFILSNCTSLNDLKIELVHSRFLNFFKEGMAYSDECLRRSILLSAIFFHFTGRKEPLCSAPITSPKHPIFLNKMKGKGEARTLEFRFNSDRSGQEYPRMGDFDL